MREGISQDLQVSAQERGATAVEYALMISLVALFIVGGVAFLGTELAQSFSDSCAAIFGSC